MPKMSILCPAYNHEKYVDAFLGSVVSQTCEDWELIIVDDASTDSTVERILKFTDPRIRLVRHDFNQGINAGLSDACELAVAPVCALIASDDMLEPTYVEEVLAELDSHCDCDVGYVRLARMDANGRKDGKVLGKVTNDYGETLFERMFLGGDMFVSPGMFVRTSALREILPLHRGICQRQDQLLEMQLAFRHKFLFINHPLVRYRQCGTGVSTRSEASLAREKSETFVLMNEISRMFASDWDLRRSFPPGGALPTAEIRREDLRFWLGVLALRSSVPERREWGLWVIAETIGTSDRQREIFERYGFSFSNYLHSLDGLKIGFSKEERKIIRLRRRNQWLIVILIVTWILFALTVFAQS